MAYNFLLNHFSVLPLDKLGLIRGYLSDGYFRQKHSFKSVIWTKLISRGHFFLKYDEGRSQYIFPYTSLPKVN